MIACVGGKMSPVTVAMYKEFRDPFYHEPRTASMTLAQLHIAQFKADPSNLQVFFHEAQCFHLNGVSKPFFKNFPLLYSSSFLMPKMLHYLHKECWDHDIKWCLNVIGNSELDFQLSIMQPIAGYCHFKSRISKLKQITGRVHHDIQCYLIGIIAGAAPPQFVTAICALMDFQYCVQAYYINANELQLITTALDTFHANKQSILAYGAQQGKGNKPINNWYIPKLELMQNFVPSISQLGVPIQWSANVTEHAHISEIKIPARASNNNNYDPQICWYLD